MCYKAFREKDPLGFHDPAYSVFNSFHLSGGNYPWERKGNSFRCGKGFRSESGHSHTISRNSRRVSVADDNEVFELDPTVIDYK